jgi:hypothetical protein
VGQDDVRATAKGAQDNAQVRLLAGPPPFSPTKSQSAIRARKVIVNVAVF